MNYDSYKDPIFSKHVIIQILNNLQNQANKYLWIMPKKMLFWIRFYCWYTCNIYRYLHCTYTKCIIKFRIPTSFELWYLYVLYIRISIFAYFSWRLHVTKLNIIYTIIWFIAIWYYFIVEIKTTLNFLMSKWVINQT